MARNYKQLSIEERTMIQTQLEMGVKPATIAKDLAAVAGVHVRTVETWLSRARREGTASLAEK